MAQDTDNKGNVLGGRECGLSHIAQGSESSVKDAKDHKVGNLRVRCNERNELIDDAVYVEHVPACWLSMIIWERIIFRNVREEKKRSKKSTRIRTALSLSGRFGVE